MASGIFRHALGKIAEIASEHPLTVVLLKQAEVLDNILGYENVADVLASAGNVEAEFENYARADDTAVVTIDDVNDEVTVALNTQQWTYPKIASATEYVTNVIIAYQSGVDGDNTLIPVISVTTNTPVEGDVLRINGGVIYRCSGVLPNIIETGLTTSDGDLLITSDGDTLVPLE